MKKITGIIVLIGLLVLIGFGFTYKMVEPDGWDRIVETVVEQMPVLENIIPEKTLEPQPTATPVPEVTVAPNEGGDSEASYRKEESGTATPTPSATPEATVTPSPSPEVDFENMTYEVYYNLPAEIQYEFYKTFEDPLEFMEWHDIAKKEYEEEQKNEIVLNPDGSINLGDYINSSSSDGN